MKRQKVGDIVDDVWPRIFQLVITKPEQWIPLMLVCRHWKKILEKYVIPFFRFALDTAYEHPAFNPTCNYPRHTVASLKIYSTAKTRSKRKGLRIAGSLEILRTMQPVESHNPETKSSDKPTDIQKGGLS